MAGGPFDDWARLLRETEAGRAALARWRALAAAMAEGDAKAFRALTDPAAMALGPMGADFRRLVGGAPPTPPQAPAAEWPELKAAFAEWASLIAMAWAEAVGAFAHKAATPGFWDKGAAAPTECWTAAADAAFSALFASDRYIAALRRLALADAEARIAARIMAQGAP